MHPVQAQALPKDDFKAIASFFRIGFDTERIGISECDRVSCEALRIHMGAGESIFDDCTVIDIECDCVVRCVLVSGVHLAEPCRGNWGILKGSVPQR